MKMTERVAIVIPVYNEEKTLVEKVLQLEDSRRQNFPSYDIIITDNNSTDSTTDLAEKIASEYERISYYFVEQKGKGAAVKETWLGKDYDIYSFMDVDLSTDLEAFPILIEEMKKGYDIAIGSRFAEGAIINRGYKREVISRGYRALFKLLFNTRIKDPQCGFKAINRKVRDNVLPNVKENGFFFDTELLIRSVYAGYSIKEVPVKWTEDITSTVNIPKDVPKFLKGLVKLKYEQLTGKLGE